MALTTHAILSPLRACNAELSVSHATQRFIFNGCDRIICPSRVSLKRDNGFLPRGLFAGSQSLTIAALSRRKLVNRFNLKKVEHA